MPPFTLGLGWLDIAHDLVGRVGKEMSTNDEVVVKTLVFHDCGEASLKADIHYIEGRVNPLLPPVLFLHGGALMMGRRELTVGDGSLHLALLKAGFTVVSADYRLVPQHTLSEAVQDVEDACQWIRTQSGTAFPGAVNRLIVMGVSAGGYLSLVAGFRVTPRPDCVVSLWGYGDITSDWYTTPSKFYCQMPAVSRETAYSREGGDLYLYARQTGTWPEIVTRWNLSSDMAKIREYEPRYNADAAYPPTFFLTGTEDQDVPYTQTTLMAHALAEAAVPIEVLAIPKGGHTWGETKPADAHLAHERIIAFLNRTVQTLSD